MKTKLDYFKEHAWRMMEEDDDNKDVYRIEDDEGDWGFLYITDSAEEFDNHCNQCMKEILVLRFSPFEDFPFRYYTICVGKTRFEKIKSRELTLPGNLVLKENLLNE